MAVKHFPNTVLFTIFIEFSFLLFSASWVEVPSEEDYIDVYVSNVNTTTDISVIIIGPDHLEELKKLETILSKYFDDDAILPSVSLEIGKYCVAYSDNSWYRVELLSIMDNECEVLLVDHGSKSIVSLEEVKDLPMKFCKLPFQVSSHVCPILDYGMAMVVLSCIFSVTKTFCNFIQ